MKFLTILFLLALVAISTSKAQDTTKIKQFYSKDFNWTITIPPNFDTVSIADWNRFKNKGAEAVEKTYDQKITDKTITIFVFRSGMANYFEANYQPFDAKKDGNYKWLNKNVDAVLYHTLATQIPGSVIDSATTITAVGKVSFDAFILRATLPNGVVFSIYSFSRLFGKRDFTVNIMFINNDKGNVMLDAWKKSVFAVN
jgi:hypothetical protein